MNKSVKELRKRAKRNLKIDTKNIASLGHIDMKFNVPRSRNTPIEKTKRKKLTRMEYRIIAFF